MILERCASGISSTAGPYAAAFKGELSARRYKPLTLLYNGAVGASGMREIWQRQ